MKAFRFIILSLFAAIALWACGFAAFSIAALMASPQKVNETSDAIIVLTGGKNRIDQGLALFAQGKASNLFISGVHPDVRKREITARWRGDTALPPCCISLGKSATTTIENATETAAWAKENDVSSIRLVTSNYHMARAKLELSATMPQVDILTHPITQDDLNTGEQRIWELLFSEYHKYVLRFAQLLFS